MNSAQTVSKDEFEIQETMPFKLENEESSVHKLVLKLRFQTRSTLFTVITTKPINYMILSIDCLISDDVIVLNINRITR